MTTGNPPMTGLAGRRAEGERLPCDTWRASEADPREWANVVDSDAWVVLTYLKLIGESYKSLEKYPNPKPVKLTEFGP